MRAFKDAKELRQFLPADVDLRKFRAILGESLEDPEFMVVKRQPNVRDLEANKLFMGPEGIAIRRAMVVEGLKPYYTSVFPFAHPTEQVNLNLARQAQGVFAEECRRVGVNKYLLMGVETAKLHPLFTYEFTKLNDILHRNIVVGDNVFRVVHHPGIIAQNPTVFRDFVDAAKELVWSTQTRKIPKAPNESYLVVTNAEQARTILGRMGDRVAVDLETTGLDPYTCKILTVNVSWVEGQGYAFPYKIIAPDEWAAFFRGKHLLFQNGSFDVKVFANQGIYLRVSEDSMLMHSLVDETPGSHSMEIMSKKFLNIDKWKELVDYGDMESVDIEDLGKYGARDADLTLRLCNLFNSQVSNTPIHTVLHRAQNSIIRSELRGVRVDRERAFEFDEEIVKAMHDRREYLADTYGLENPNSPKQVANLLYDVLGLPIQRLKGKISTGEKALERIKDDHAVISDIFEYRHLTKASGTYLKNLLKESERDGRYHPEFKLASTETGRLSEKLIMLIPRPDFLENPDLGKQYQVRLRELFIPDEGYVIIGADYSGLEVAMAAYLTGDMNLIQDLRDGIDTHSVVAIQAFELDEPLEPYSTLKKRVSAKYGYQRTIAKSATFTWLYGGAAGAIARNAGISREIAAGVLASLRKRYPGVADWQERIKEAAQRYGVVKTPWGRTRRFMFHPGMDRGVVEAQLREAINTPNQGMASDMTLAAFTQIEERGYETLFPLHDAVYLQVREEDAEKAASDVKRIMESVLPGIVPFRADVKVGENWAKLG